MIRPKSIKEEGSRKIADFVGIVQIGGQLVKKGREKGEIPFKNGIDLQKKREKMRGFRMKKEKICAKRQKSKSIFVLIARRRVL
ncbi:MAG: hypothetical protein IJO51_00695 [Clostridia bacterium]|nr:hypothetical protein [Clostridia bacterium]